MLFRLSLAAAPAAQVRRGRYTFGGQFKLKLASQTCWLQYSVPNVTQFVGLLSLSSSSRQQLFI